MRSWACTVTLRPPCRRATRARRLPDERPAEAEDVVSRLFLLRLGATAFGGPAAHIAMMEDEVVRRRAWLSRDGVPRPARRHQPHPRPELHRAGDPHRLPARGLAGLLVAGACFILPAALIVLRPRVGLRALRPAARAAGRALRREAGDLAIVAQALLAPRAAPRRSRRSRPGRRSRCAAARALGVHELLVLLGSRPGGAALLGAAPCAPPVRPRCWLRWPLLAAAATAHARPGLLPRSS